jgi:peptidylprolyl isomerase
MPRALTVALLALSALACSASVACEAGGPPTSQATTGAGGQGGSGSRPSNLGPTRTPPPMVIDPQKYDYTAQIVTSRGVITVKLLDDVAPVTVNSFVTLARRNYFINQVFHRITPDIAQTGDPTGTGTGGPGYSLPVEPNDIPNTRGTLAMARLAGSNVFGSQWYINLKDNPQFDAGGATDRYYVFGQVTDGFDVLDTLLAAASDDGTPKDTISIAEINIIEKPAAPATP